MLYAVVMAGGAGTRFWPASRRDRPKQVLDLAGDESMIQSTVDRFSEWVQPDRFLIVTNERLVDPIRAQLPNIPPESVIGEPCKRDTAPCVGVAAAWVVQHDPDAVMVVTPADHVIHSRDEFRQSIEFATQLVTEDAERLVTFGIRPSYPAESFGYIQRGDAIPVREASELQAYQVARFREKPQVEIARQYLADGNFYWNSGIFVWKAQTILDQLRHHEPQMFRHVQAISQSMGTPEFYDVFQREFTAIVGKSIDYAVMERAGKVVVVEAPFEWDDVGSWQALARLRGVDSLGNTIVARHLGIDTEGSIVRGPDDHLIVTVGLKDCLIVHTPDATLVADKNDEERIREVVKALEEQQWDDYL